MKLPWQQERSSATFEILTRDVVVHTVTITPGERIHIDQPIEIFLGDEAHTFHVRETSVRWVG